MEEYLLTHGMLTPVEEWMLERLGNDLTAQGRQSLTDILTVKESYLAAALSAIHQRYGTVDARLAKSISSPLRFAPICRPGCWKNSVFLPRGGAGVARRDAAAGTTGKKCDFVHI